jgi:N-acetylmuramoyl-L-alanine amidase-like protein
MLAAPARLPHRLSITRPRANVAPPIVQMLIPFGAARAAQMRAYARRHYGIDSDRLVHPQLIVWHFTESPTVASTFNAFASDQPDVEYHELPNVCAHFVVGADGTIYQLVPLDLMCRHVVGLNYTAIGIEDVAFSDRQVLDDQRQLQATLALTHYLRCRFHLPSQNVIGHNESLSSPYYRELVPAFRGRTHADWVRADMERVRALVRESAC